MMRRTLPPLNAIRVFEAAARHLSFRKAAEELHVTPGAVSQQIQTLEEHLGIALFERLPRGLRLTACGQQYLPGVGEAMRLLVAATASLRSDREVINLSIAPSLCTRWLMSRLGRFCEEHPQIEVRIDASSRIANLTDGSFDLAIRYTAKRYGELQYESLFLDEAFPVCSPAVSERLGADPRRLGETLLLHWSSHDQWDLWFEHAGVTAPDRSQGLFFSHLMLALDAAQSGQGVALTSLPLVSHDLEAGRLVRPFGPAVKTGYEYVVAGRPAAFRQAKVQAFTAWITAEARAQLAIPAKRVRLRK